MYYGVDRPAVSNPVISEQEFFDRLEKTPRNWTVDFRGRINFDDGHLCPYLYIHKESNFDIVRSAFLNDIFSAADNRPDHSAELRSKLMAACGLAGSE